MGKFASSNQALKMTDSTRMLHLLTLPDTTSRKSSHCSNSWSIISLGLLLMKRSSKSTRAKSS